MAMRPSAAVGSADGAAPPRMTNTARLSSASPGSERDWCPRAAATTPPASGRIRYVLNSWIVLLPRVARWCFACRRAWPAHPSRAAPRLARAEVAPSPSSGGLLRPRRTGCRPVSAAPGARRARPRRAARRLAVRWRSSPLPSSWRPRGAPSSFGDGAAAHGRLVAPARDGDGASRRSMRGCTGIVAGLAPSAAQGTAASQRDRVLSERVANRDRARRRLAAQEGAHVLQHPARVGVALIAVEGERAIDDEAHVARRVRRALRERRRRPPAHLQQEVEVGARRRGCGGRRSAGTWSAPTANRSARASMSRSSPAPVACTASCRAPGPSA